MKRSILACVLAIACVASSSGANLLSNGGFEAAGTAQSLAVNWEWMNPNAHGATWGTATRESWRAYAGGWEASIRGTWGGADNGGWWQEAAAVPGATYTLSAWFWADGTWTNQGDQGLKLEFFSGTATNVGSLLSATTNCVTGIGEAWVKKTVQGTAPTNTAWVRATFFASAVGSQGALQIDEANLSAEPGTVILISQVPWLVSGLGLVCLVRRKAGAGRFHSSPRS